MSLIIAMNNMLKFNVNMQAFVWIQIYRPTH